MRAVTPMKTYVAFVLLSFLVYSRAFDNPFRQDDFTFCRHVASLEVQDVFDRSANFSFYRPGAIALFALEYAFLGENGGKYLIINYFLHVVISLGVWLVLRRIGVSARGAFLASGLFVLGVGHYGKEIMWACTSGLLMSVVLSLAALVLTFAWLSSDQRGPANHGVGRRGYPLGISVALGTAPLFHEASLFTIPVILVMVLIYGSRSRRRRIGQAAPCLLVLLVWVVVSRVFSEAYGTYRIEWEGASRAPVYLVRYLGFMVLPFQRTRIVALPGVLDDAVAGAVHVQMALGIAVALALGTAILKGSASWRAMSAWLILWLLPFTTVRMPEAWLELRYLYCASIPFCGLLGHGFDVIGSRPGSRLKRLRYHFVAGLVVMTVVLLVLLERQYGRASG